MNLSDPKHPWSRLVVAARSAPDTLEAEMPYGFATRVASLAFERGPAVSLIERFAFRAVGVACLLAVASVVVNYPALSSRPAASATATTDDDAPADDPVALLIDT